MYLYSLWCAYYWEENFENSYTSCLEVTEIWSPVMWMYCTCLSFTFACGVVFLFIALHMSQAKQLRSWLVTWKKKKTCWWNWQIIIYNFHQWALLLLCDDLGIVEYPILDCVVNVCMHVWLDDGSCLCTYFSGRGDCHVVCRTQSISSEQNMFKPRRHVSVVFLLCFCLHCTVQMLERCHTGRKCSLSARDIFHWLMAQEDIDGNMPVY